MSESPRAHVLRSGRASALAPVLVSSPPPSSPTYQVIRLLDEGGMAKLYLAHRRLEHAAQGLVVLKQARSFVARDAELRRMFLDEAALGARLRHDNVVHTLGVVEEGDTLAMVMPYVDGQSLARVRERCLLDDPRETLALSLYVLSLATEGLHYAHSLCDESGAPLSVVHRDVSPQNVILTYSGAVKVVDFGLARHALRGAGEPAVPFKGKLAYAAPEQVAGGSVDRRTDVFALGVMLWEALANRRLWQGMDNAEIHARLLTHAWPSLRDVNPGADPELRALCEAAMQERPDGRPVTARAFRDRLDAAIARLHLNMSAARAGGLIAQAFADEREELRTLLLEYFEGDSAASGFYPACP